jgi:hypothetical protein
VVVEVVVHPSLEVVVVVLPSLVAVVAAAAVAICIEIV